MKAYLTTKYELVIEAESAIEMIELEAWSDDYLKETPEKSSLLILLTATGSINHAEDASNKTAIVVKCMHGYTQESCGICSARA